MPHVERRMLSESCLMWRISCLTSRVAQMMRAMALSLLDEIQSARQQIHLQSYKTVTIIITLLGLLGL